MAKYLKRETDVKLPLLQIPQLTPAIRIPGMEDTLSTLTQLEADLARRHRPLLEKFDLKERFGSLAVAEQHMKNLQRATYIVEGNIDELRELSESRSAAAFPLHPDLFSGSVFCARSNLAVPALHSGVFETDLEHVRDALNVMRGWARLKKPG
jgi:hypothetical protein